jgi:hypothetical protein
VKGCERFCLFLEEPPKPVLEHGVRGFDVAGEPRFAHRAMQFLLIISQMFPFDNREHHSPHVGGPELLKKPVTKEQKVTSVFDLDLACGRNSVQCGNFKQLGTKCGGHGKSCAEIIRHRRRCDLPCATEGRTAECCSASSVCCLRDFVLGVLATASHCVEASACSDEGSIGGAMCAMARSCTAQACLSERQSRIRGPGTREETCRLLARM